VSTYSPPVADLLREPRLAPLGPGTPNLGARPRLEALTIETAFAPHPVADRELAAACLAGLWLYHDFLDESHRLSQDIDTPEGSYWHGLMHRREPDYSNAKYWFRRVGAHPVFPAVHAAALALAAAELPPVAGYFTGRSGWDPLAFIDLCEASAAGRVPCEMLCRRVQGAEWDLLFDYCYRRAIGTADGA
jgi:hypothetical protein